MKRFLLECGHYALGEGQLVGDRRTCEVCPRSDCHGMRRMIVDVIDIPPELISDEFAASFEEIKERGARWSPVHLTMADVHRDLVTRLATHERIGRDR